MSYKRILLKISGESLLGEKKFGVDLKFLEYIGEQIKRIVGRGVQVAIVIGGGNIWRGSEWEKMGMDRSTADYIGMLATVMNALALQSVLEKMGLVVRVQSAINIMEVCEPYIRRRAIRHLEKGRVVIFAAGTGNPFFTTDTAAALRAAEIGAEVILKATNVDGVYSKDPHKYKEAKLLKEISFTEFLAMNLRALDPTAISLSRDSKIPVIVFNIKKPDSIYKAVFGKEGTIIKGG